jgi:hypothetical protein
MALPAAGAQTPHPIKLGNHWCSQDGHLLVLDDGRALLSDDVPAGAAVQLPLTVNIPSRPGTYWLEIDLVHDWVTWFGDSGSPCGQLPARVHAPLSVRCLSLARRLRRAASASREVTVPVMESSPRDFLTA